MKLQFIVGGAQKCGTTALWSFLYQHPQVGVSSLKELHFFDNENLDWNDPGYGSLHSHFESASRRACGDITPIYMYWKPCFERIYTYNRDIKLIFILRDPVIRAWSQWRMETARGAESLSFGQAIREGRQRISTEAEIPGFHRVFSYVERGFYAEQLDRAFALFPAENILVLKQVDLLNRQRGVLDQICDFIGVDLFPTYPENKIVFSHAQGEDSNPPPEDHAYLAQIYQNDLERLKHKYGIEL